MTAPPGRELDPSVRAQETETARGVFATLECATTSRPISRGHALLVPGFTGSKEDFAALLPLLAEAGWAVATYDQRGQFETPGGPNDDYSLDGFAADAEAVCAAVFGEVERVHLVGHSFGGLVAAHAVLRDPSLWASLTLVCSGPGGLHSGVVYDEARFIAAAIPRDRLESVYDARRTRDAERGFAPSPPTDEAFSRRRFLASCPESLVAMARHLCDTADRSEDLLTVDVPVAIVRGADDTWPHDDQDALAATLDTRVQVIEGAAHSPAAEQPESTRDALVRTWLR